MLRYLIEKEFKQILRNPFMSKVIFILPTMILLILPWAANQEIKDMKLSIVDNDHSVTSERLVNKITSSGYFHLKNVSSSYNNAIESVEGGKADAIIEICKDFEKNLINIGKADVLVAVNSVNGVKGSLGTSYMSNIIQDFSNELIKEKGSSAKNAGTSQFSIKPRYSFNPNLDYKIFMIPAIMVMLLTIITGFLPALNIVGEKEKGTIEQLNVTPVKKSMFILAKLIPYWIIGYIVLTIGIILGALIYGLFPAGNLMTIYIYATIYIIVVSGMGLVISNYSNTMQQAQFISVFFIMILILISGLFFPINSMPRFAQILTYFNPLRFFMEVMRAVYLKGSAMRDLLPQFGALCIFAIILNGWAIWSYRKVN